MIDDLIETEVKKITDFAKLPKHAVFGELLRLLFNPLEKTVPDAQV